MTALQLTDIKNFMNQFLRSEIFDRFLLTEAVIIQDVAVTIDGHIQKGYFSREELEEKNLAHARIIPYSFVRPGIYQLIRGKKTPVYFKFVLMLSPENMERTLAKSDSGLTGADVSGMFLNLVYQNGTLLLTTGISYQTFCGEKTLDREWDKMMQIFLNKYSIPFEKL